MVDRGTGVKPGKIPKEMGMIDTAIREQNRRLKQLQVEYALEELRYRSEHEDVTADQKIVMSKIQEYQNFWDAEAIFWSKRMNAFERKAVITMLGSFDMGLCLNLGSGMENYLDHPMVCLDYSKEMLKNNPSPIKVLHNMDSAGLPFRDASFDTVLAAFSLNYVYGLDRLVAEILRVLKPGGHVLALSTQLNRWYIKESRHSQQDVARSINHGFKESTERKKGKICLIIGKK